MTAGTSSTSALAMGAVAGALAGPSLRRVARSLSFDRSPTSTSSGGAASSPSSSDGRPPASSSPRGSRSSAANDKNVGILAIEVYTPSTYVSQSDLESHSAVAPGRYTIGLGQNGIAVTGDAEDVNSLSLTVVRSLLDKYGVDPETEVGRLEVGTETLVDKSKSTKTVLMQLFGSNTDVEGATVVNACYGGTAALLNALAWVESDAWDGRYAIVVAADVASYDRGPARPTSGCGAVAVLVGRDAPLAMADPSERASHAAHVWDFFKPDHAVEYPTVDGGLSQVCYYRALEDVYARFADKMQAKAEAEAEKGDGHDRNQFTAESADYFVFHAPYNKLVQKSYARLYLLDARRRHQRREEAETKRFGGSPETVPASDSDSASDASSLGEYLSPSSPSPSPSPSPASSPTSVSTPSAGVGPLAEDDPLAEWLDKPIEDTYSDKALENVLKKVSAASFRQRLGDANAASQEIGNTYTASVFFGLASLVDRAGGRGELTPGKTAVVFSYGSGALATMYRLHVREPTTPAIRERFGIAQMVAAMNLTERLASRERVPPSELDHALETRARMHRAGAPYSPVYPTAGRLFPGTYYLHGIDAKWRRSYGRVPLDAAMADPPGAPLAPPIVLRLEKRDEVSCPVTGKLRVLSDSEDLGTDLHTEAKRRIACVITGTSAGLPGGGDGPVFRPDNLDRLVRGENCIAPIGGQTKAELIDKNVVQLKKMPDGTRKRVPVDNQEDIIKVAAQLGTIDLTALYGVPPGLAETMDIAAQVAVAAGLEALKSAGLVCGKSNDPKEWVLPEQYRDSTGVIYASSFPAMDAAVGEVMRFLQSKTVGAADTMRLVSALRSRLLRASPVRELSDDDEAAFARLLTRAREIEGMDSDDGSVSEPYEFDRKFLFRVLVLGNAQLAQLAGCRGPNTQTNAACAGTTQAIAMAQDMLISGRAERVVVVAGDNASGPALLPWLGSGFRALGAATTAEAVEDAACPFDRRRSGMLLGAGGIGMVLETEESSEKRLRLSSPRPFSVKARLLASQYSNSAFHGAALDRKHIASELKRFLDDIELVHGICKAEVATHGVYLSHETGTHASPSSSCAGNEVAALREAFGDELLLKMPLLSTKGFTGHPMGVSFEDVAAVEALTRQTIPPVPNYREEDPNLGKLNIATEGGPYAFRYALRFAAGFGSQVAFALYSTVQE
jgi:3-hydroxy-3-methylglutaryl CoA synthase